MKIIVKQLAINLNFNYYERNYQGKLNIYKLCLLTKKFLFILIIKKINLYINTKNKKAIKIQSNIRRLLFSKKFNAFKRDLIKLKQQGIIIEEGKEYIIKEPKGSYNSLPTEFVRRMMYLCKKGINQLLKTDYNEENHHYCGTSMSCGQGNTGRM